VRFPAKDKEGHCKDLFPVIMHRPLFLSNFILVAQLYDSDKDIVVSFQDLPTAYDELIGCSMQHANKLTAAFRSNPEELQCTSLQ